MSFQQTHARFDLDGRDPRNPWSADRVLGGAPPLVLKDSSFPGALGFIEAHTPAIPHAIGDAVRVLERRRPW